MREKKQWRKPRRLSSQPGALSFANPVVPKYGWLPIRHTEEDIVRERRGYSMPGDPRLPGEVILRAITESA